MHGNEHYKRKASLTIELSLLMPGIISILIFIIYSGFYYHDRCVIEGAAYSAVLKCGSGYIYDCDHITNDCSLERIKEEINRNFNDGLTDRLTARWDISSSPYIDGEIISLKIIGKMELPGGFFIDYMGGHIFSLYLKESAMYVFEPQSIRR